MRSIAAKLQAVLIRLIILVLMLFMGSIGLRFITDYVLVSRLGMDNAFTQFMLQGKKTVLNADQRIAVAGAGALTGGVARTDSPVNMLKDVHRQYTTLARRVTNNVNTYANQQLMFRRPLVEAANSYEKAIGWNLAGYSEYNNVIDLGDGYLTKFSSRFNVRKNVESVAEFKKYLDAQNLPMLFVQLPSKIPRQDTVVNNVVDFYNDNARRLVGGLREYGVNTLDLRDDAEQLNLDYRSLFYNTDHHWRAETGLWAAGEIGEELNRNFGFGIDLALYNPDNYTFKRYEKASLGSLGKKVTLARATPDDFTLIYPKFDVNLTLKIPAINLEATGGFDIIFDYSQLEIEDLYKRELYGMYLHNAIDQHDFFQLENNLTQVDPHKVLLLGDSFNYALVPYLGLGFDHIDYVDLRNYAGSLQELIADGGYDQVIISHSQLTGVNDRGLNMYDFR